jgi:tetratricopeptide (TPR) repeat protein
VKVIEFMNALGTFLGATWPWALIALVAFSLFHPKSLLRTLLDRANFLKFKRGDTEIEFEREPQSTELATKSGAVAVAVQVTDEAEARQIPGPNKSGPGDLTSRMIEAFYEKDFERAESTFKGLIEAEPNALVRLRHETTYQALRYMQAGDESALVALESLAKNTEIRAYVYSWIARSYENSNRLDDAIAAYDEARRSPSEEDERARYTVWGASCLVRIGKTHEAFQRLVDALRTSPPGEPQAILYDQIAEMEKERGNKVEVALASEMVAFNRPRNTTARFNAAYAADEADLVHLACANYSTLLKFDPEMHSAHNNQGVSLEKIDLTIHSIAAFQAAAEKGNTLAMANLAYKYIAAGFAKEAEEQVASALKQANPNENVGSALAHIAAAKKAEEQELQKVLVLGSQQQRFFQLFYPSYLTSPSVESLPSGKWVYGDTAVSVSIGADGLILEWGDGPSRRRVEGPLRNRAGIVKMKKTTKNFISGEWQFGSGSPAYVYFDERLDRLNILSTEAGEGIYEIVCIRD